MPRPQDAELLRPKRNGATLLDRMWDDLLGCIDTLMLDREGGIEWECEEDRARCQGRAEGVAWCIAVLTQSPRTVDINEIKREAMERWEEIRSPSGRTS